MPGILGELPLTNMSPTAVRWTRKDCDEFEKAGLLNYQYELVEGVINRMGQNILHAILLKRIMEWMRESFGLPPILSQMSIDVAPEDNPTSKPMPDVVLLTKPDSEFRDNPKADEVLLLVEVSDTTLSYDLGVKAGLYARAGIPEYWVIDIPNEQVHVHRSPADGVYEVCTAYGNDVEISPISKPGATLDIRTLFETDTA